MTHNSNGAPREDVWCDSAQHRKAILIVDDFEATRTLIEMQLADLNHDLDFASEGEQALQKIAQKTYDLVLMDVEMPGMDGHETMQLIRQWEEKNRMRPTPIIAITAHSDLLEPESGKSQWTSVLHKPLTRAQLVNKVSAHLSEAR